VLLYILLSGSVLSGKKRCNFSGLHNLHFISDHGMGTSRTQENHFASFNIMHGEMGNRSENRKVNRLLSYHMDYLLGRETIESGTISPTFRRKVPPPSSGQSSKPNMKPASRKEEEYSQVNDSKCFRN
jgi:hypothetical protein